MNKFQQINDAVPYVVIERGRKENESAPDDWAICLNEKHAEAAEFEGVAEDYRVDILDALEAAQALSNKKGYPLVLSDCATQALIERLRVKTQSRESSYEQSTGIFSTVPVISTSHLTYATMEELERVGDNNPWAHCANYEYGFCLSIPSEDQDDDAYERPVPADLRGIWDWARSKDMGWVRLDQAADAIDELPEYDWDADIRRAIEQKAVSGPEM